MLCLDTQDGEPDETADQLRYRTDFAQLRSTLVSDTTTTIAHFLNKIGTTTRTANMATEISVAARSGARDRCFLGSFSIGWWTIGKREA